MADKVTTEWGVGSYGGLFWCCVVQFWLLRARIWVQRVRFWVHKGRIWLQMARIWLHRARSWVHGDRIWLHRGRICCKYVIYAVYAAFAAYCWLAVEAQAEAIFQRKVKTWFLGPPLAEANSRGRLRPGSWALINNQQTGGYILQATTSQETRVYINIF